MAQKKRKSLSLRLIWVFVAAFGVAGLSGYVSKYGQGNSDPHRHQSSSRVRRSQQEDTLSASALQGAEANCTPRSMEEFPPDFLTLQQRQAGGVLIHILICLYIFAALAIVCDDYFVSSLEFICERVGVQSDVAGATFMAAGSSAPELFTSVIGVFFAKSDVGVGTIVGSAVFNILFIIGICGLGAGMVVHLTWWPLFRDTSFYTVTVVALIVVIYDEKVHWYEALVFLAMYLLYVTIMYFNPRLGDYWIRRVASWREGSATSSGAKSVDDPERQPLLRDNHLDASGSQEWSYSKLGSPSPSTLTQNETPAASNKVDVASSNGLLAHTSATQLSGSAHAQSSFVRSHTELDVQEESDYESPLSFPDGCGRRSFWVVMLPATLLFWATIPDCRRPGTCWKRLFLATFTVSILWIAGLSYVMVWMVTIIGDTLSIPDTVMGLTLLAAGTSVPDALSSLFVARDGYGDMAVSNSIGSNVFDILVGLGLPWLIQTAIVSPNDVIFINSAGLTFSAITLLATVVFLLTIVSISNWRLNKKVGTVCLLVYVMFVALSCMYELNVFGYLNPPPCPRQR